MTRNLLPRFFLAYMASSTLALSLPPFPQFISASNFLQTQKPVRSGLDTWIDKEERISLDRLLANIKPGGRNVEGVQGKSTVDGTVVASPSREEPDYWYQWVRDAAITTSTLVEIYTATPLTTPLSTHISSTLTSYTALQSSIQHRENPSGTFDDLSSLGEPKFHVDGTPFAGSWGRPQRDGPALRAITLISWLRAYNTTHPSLWNTRTGDAFYEKLYAAELPAQSPIKADLEYTSHTWNETSFDLWEEVDGMHFFTAMMQLRALREGAQIARAFDDFGAADWYAEQARYMRRFVKRFWNKRKGHLVATLWSRRSGLDCGVLLGAVRGIGSAQVRGDGMGVWEPWEGEVLGSLLEFVNDQKRRFPLNSKHKRDVGSDDNDSTEEEKDTDTDEEDMSIMPSISEPTLTGTALGRYPEDTYDGYSTTSTGNPWFICTSTAAELLYKTAAYHSTSSNLTITPTALPFYKALLSTSSLDVSANTLYGTGDVVFHSILERLKMVGDEFLEVVKEHVDVDGGMSEQFDRETGFMRGAGDLTWSYGAFLSAVRERRRLDGEV